MNPSHPLARIVQWTAWITGSLLLAFLLFMLVGHLVGDANGPNGMAFRSAMDTLAFVLFPIGTLIGLVLAYKWELSGGLVVVRSIVLLCILRPDLLHSSLITLTVPGWLYVAHGAIGRHAAKREPAG